MGQFFLDISGTTIGALPSDMTLRRNSTSAMWGAQDLDGARVLRYLASTGTGSRAVSFDAITSSGVSELFSTFRAEGSPRFALFASDSPDSELAVTAATDSNVISAYARVSGSFNGIATANFTLSFNNYYSIRFRVTPGTPKGIKVRVWEAGTTEPATWQIDTTTSLGSTTSGYAGLISFDSNKFHLFKDVGIGTDGDAAPKTAVAAPTTLDTPANLAGVFGARSVDLRWDAVTGADYYEYEFRQV